MTAADPRRPFGRLLTAMVTPFGVSGELDLDAAVALATYLVDEQGNDGLVINGTTGESPTTSDAEKAELVRAVADAVGDRAHIVTGVGTFDTVHTIHLAEQAAKAGADGLLVVTPYYSRPPQAGLLAHFRAVADATELPVALYDIPGRSGTAIQTETLIELAGHERIVAVKDAKGDLVGSSRVLAETDLAYYSGDDAATLPLLSVGAVGVIGTSTHFSGAGTKAMIEAFERGDVAEATRLHRQLLPIYTGIFRTQGTILVKAGLKLRGRDVGPVRLPLVDATEHEISHLREDLAAAGL
ncbi:MAG: 4-hydroxy-tetrahydrodipicolinate synthase [Pseudonocardiales bacterium]|jgi:4-hydroxy-tetrahydrodipicolinate synthase|nr:dapA [Pseudonocardiales bacterium]MDT4956479.1 4-hydroxy-tetrahydrodipicolinate synthase [Pseudonocardiales bacterium]MDT4963736.1 4-hydroxy-tetrahydrodipicolinate synthase [Pseudonocardiales bacterium]MDT4976046.1 4-hydroxy-tetrahydrodipicolinate synthase [Pseudonocardiales bacterium]